RIAVEAARARIAGVIDRVGDAAVGLERGFGTAVAHSPGIACRGHPEIALEKALEVVRRITDGERQLIERRCFLGALDQLDGASDGLAVAPDLVRLAAQAWPVTRRASLVPGREEFDMLALRAPRRATRLAVDAGRLHRAEHPPVPAPVAAHERRPGSVRVEASDFLHAIRSRPVKPRCNR